MPDTNENKLVQFHLTYLSEFGARMDWGCQAEDFDHAVEQLLNAEPEAFSIKAYSTHQSRAWMLTSSCGVVHFDPKTGDVLYVDEDLEDGEDVYLGNIRRVDIPATLAVDADLATYDKTDILFAGYWHMKDGKMKYEHPCFGAVLNSLEAGGSGFGPGITIEHCQAMIEKGESS